MQYDVDVVCVSCGLAVDFSLTCCLTQPGSLGFLTKGTIPVLFAGQKVVQVLCCVSEQVEDE